MVAAMVAVVMVILVVMEAGTASVVTRAEEAEVAVDGCGGRGVVVWRCWRWVVEMRLVDAVMVVMVLVEAGGRERYWRWWWR